MWAKRHYVRIKRWQPKAGRWMDWSLRRQSAQRREAHPQVEKKQPSGSGEQVPEIDLRPPFAIGAHDSGCLFGGPFSFDF